MRFCFKDVRTMVELHVILLRAIAFWTPAFQYAAASIQPDVACDGDYWCLCGKQPNGKGTDFDVLVIWQHCPDDNDPSTCMDSDSATLGYDQDEPWAGRQRLSFGYTNAPSWDVEGAVVQMAHECE